MKYLMDVNALIAAIWTDHVGHSTADAWVKSKSLVTCPFSELGFLRVSAHPKALGSAMADARKLLEGFLTKHAVEFLAADLPALKTKATRSEELKDLYLADLAAANRMKLATFDSKISHPAVELIR